MIRMMMKLQQGRINYHRKTKKNDYNCNKTLKVDDPDPSDVCRFLNMQITLRKCSLEAQIFNLVLEIQDKTGEQSPNDHHNKKNVCKRFRVENNLQELMILTPRCLQVSKHANNFKEMQITVSIFNLLLESAVSKGRRQTITR